MRIIYLLFRVSLIGLISRFRCGCHGLHDDTGRFVNTPRDDTVCEVCKSGCVRNEHHFLFDCPAYAHIQYSHATLFHGIQTVSSVINSNNFCLLGRYLRQCFEHRQSVLGGSKVLCEHQNHRRYCLSVFTVYLDCLLAPCWSPGH